eukprot:m.208038 g.208038  ORF g.208038 m.208038 type:complete len:760 (-) comp24002_c0_seq1:88-2367(-)
MQDGQMGFDSDGHAAGPAIPFDTVDYAIYVPIPPGADGNAAARSAWGMTVLQQCNDLVASICAQHTWHRDTFAIRLVGVNEPTHTTTTTGASRPAASDRVTGDICLRGRTHFGDNIEDEWVIVHLVQRITLMLDGAVATVRDADGEFLLVEVADHLPAWVNPETAINRVFLHQGAVHLVPPPTSPAQIGVYPVGTPSLDEAVPLVRSNHETVAPPNVAAAIAQRLGQYPNLMHASVHWARCDIPAQLGAALAKDPSLVAPAVAAFYERDPIDMKHCGAMTRFPPSTRVPVSVRFTRCLYAMLAQQRFESARVFGAPPRAGTSAFRAHDLGAKLALGFEILAHRHVPTVTSVASTQGRDDKDVCTGARWDRFLGKLQTSGYFRDNIDGSRDHQALMTAARRYYVTTVVPSETAAAASATSASSSHHDTAHAATYLDRAAARLHATLATCGPGPWSLDAARDDDDGWLTLEEDALMKMVRERWGNNPHPDFTDADAMGGDDNDAATAAQLDALIGKVKGFVNHVSSFEGAVVGEDEDQTDDSDDVDDTDDEDGQGGEGGLGGLDDAFQSLGGDGALSFDFAAFESTLKSMLGGGAVPTKDGQGSGTMSAQATAAVPPRHDTATSTTTPAHDNDDGIHPNAHGRERVAPATTPQQSKADGTATHQDEDSMEAISAQMDAELAGTKVMESFAGDDSGDEESASSGKANQEDGMTAPLDIDLNLVRNTLKSFSAQQGLSGPASNLLGSLNVYLPPDASLEEEGQ